MSSTKQKETDLRCTKCNRKLAEGEVIKINIKCPRCGNLNVYVDITREERTPLRDH